MIFPKIIRRVVRFGEFGLAATSLNRSSSSPFPPGEGPRLSEHKASIGLCLAESKFTKPDHAPYKLALVTGASSGLGRALAHALAKKGVALILTGRDEGRLSTLAQELPTPARYLALDLGLPADRHKLIVELEKTSPDLVINNAGFGLYGDAISHSLQDQINMIDVNITAVVEISLAAAQNWKNKQQKGIVLNVSSAVAFFSYPTFAIYAASKSFVLNFSTALDQELSDHGIRVLTVCPGQIDTEFRARASNHFPQQTDLWTMSSEKAADLILAQIAKGKRSLIIDWRYQWAVALSRLIPMKILGKRLARAIAKRIKPARDI